MWRQIHHREMVIAMVPLESVLRCITLRMTVGLNGILIRVILLTRKQIKNRLKALEKKNRLFSWYPKQPIYFYITAPMDLFGALSLFKLYLEKVNIFLRYWFWCIANFAVQHLIIDYFTYIISAIFSKSDFFSSRK